ncbi:MAG: thioredoxin family protein [Phycisphaerae bacterium]
MRSRASARFACRLTVTLVGLPLLALGCASNVVEIRDAAELQRVIADSKRPLLVDFYKAGCENCSAFEVTLRGLADEHKGQITAAKFLMKRANGEVTAEEFAQKNDILEFPTVILYVNGQERKRFVQQYNYDEYDKAINECLAAPTTRPVAGAEATATRPSD